eukprot:2828346-Pyramimonas_sp.AAC.1
MSLLAQVNPASLGLSMVSGTSWPRCSAAPLMQTAWLCEWLWHAGPGSKQTPEPPLHCRSLAGSPAWRRYQEIASALGCEGTS